MPKPAPAKRRRRREDTPAGIVLEYYEGKLPAGVPDITRPELFVHVPVRTTRRCYLCGKLMRAPKVEFAHGKEKTLRKGDTGYAKLKEGRVAKMVCSERCAACADLNIQSRFERNWKLFKQYARGKSYTELATASKDHRMTPERVRQLVNNAALMLAERKGIPVEDALPAAPQARKISLRKFVNSGYFQDYMKEVRGRGRRQY